MISPSQWKAILRRHNRIAVIGGPKAGKSTATKGIDDRPVFHTDSANHVPWEDQPAHWLKATRGHNSFVIEGVHAVRALRKGLMVDAVVHLSQDDAEAHLLGTGGHPLRPGQRAMHVGQNTMLNDVIEKYPHLPIYRS